MNNPFQKFQTREGLMILGSVTLVFAMFALLGLGVFAFAKSSSENNSQTPGTITVNGTGEVYASPDVADFAATISVDASTMADAEKSATAKGNALIASLESAGIPKADITTTDYSANPKYENQAVATPMVAPAIICNGGGCPSYPVTNSVIVGYTVSQSYSIKVRNLDNAGAIAKLLTDANISNVSGPNFAIDNPEDVQNQARAKAIADAKTQAQILAQQLGVKLGAITDFQVSNGGGIEPVAFAMNATAVGASAPAPTLPSGQTDVTSNVTITYTIK